MSVASQNTIDPKKKAQVKEIVSLAEQYSTIGITKLDGVSSSAMANIRKSLRGSTKIKVAKNTVKRVAFDEIMKKKPQTKELVPHLHHSIALIFSNENPFKLQKIFDQNRVSVFAKPGSVVSEEVWVQAGPTEFNPGPVIGEFNQAGVRTSVQQGKIHIQKDVKVLEAGDTVTELQASVLSKLDIKPVKIGIALNYALDSEGNLYEEKDLGIDEEKVLEDLKTAYQHAFNLSVFANIPTKQNITTLLNKANSHAFNLSLESNYPTKDTIQFLISKANAQAMALKKD